MTTTTAKKTTETKHDLSPATDGRGRRASRMFSGLKAGVPAVLEMALVRVFSGLGVLIFVSMTVFGFIPRLGAYLNQQAAGSLGENPSLPAVIGIWLVPFVFLVALLFVLELCLIRKFWAVGSRRVDKIKRTRLGEPVAPVANLQPVGSNKKRKK